MTGRPSDFTRALADEICERIAEGESLLLRYHRCNRLA